jgi:hypothetical protein
MGVKAGRRVLVSAGSLGETPIAILEAARGPQKEKAISIGTVTRTDGLQIGNQAITAILIHFTNRMKLRGMERSSTDAFADIWPTNHEFDDAIGIRLTHAPSRQYAFFLAKAIREETYSLL